MIKETAFRFSQKEIAPIAATIDKEDAWPDIRDMWKKFAAAGLFGVTVDTEYGGLGLGYMEHVLICEEIGRASASVALSYGAHDNLCANQLRLNGSKQQKEKYLPKLISGEWIGGLAMSEATAGSDVVSMKLKAEDKGDHFLLNGTKFWITNGPVADLLVVYAKTAPEKGPQGVTAFLVEKSFSGFSCNTIPNKVGMRGSPTGELVFDNCEVPKENVLAGVNKGVYVLMKGLEYERLIVAGLCTGLMQAAMDVVIPYTHEREQFGQKIAEFQLMQGKLTDMYTSLCASRAYVYAVANAVDNGFMSAKDCAAALLFSAEACTEVAGQAVRALGGNGYVNDYPVGRIMRDAKLTEIGAGTNEVRRWLIGREFNKEFGARE
eukprot:TRINITY_DN68123_c2_g9_i1.p1 TRINITY_DN68123_c2_g9~~TRINITY_DN68123_c2_g9_i1.p1  ORF type:complete len:427 (+),score=45.08 TRINITY_DN68123_c2_g9_i1:150-1283(+)